MQLFRFKTFAAAAVLAAAALPYLAHTMELMVDIAAVSCSDVSASALVSASTPAPAATPPRASARRLDGSQIAQGQRDISWAWLGTPTARYPHTALGSRFHAGSLHVLLAPPQAARAHCVR